MLTSVHLPNCFSLQLLTKMSPLNSLTCFGGKRKALSACKMSAVLNLAENRFPPDSRRKPSINIAEKNADESGDGKDEVELIAAEFVENIFCLRCETLAT